MTDYLSAFPCDLPKEVPVLSLPGVVLLPRARLPLNIYEARFFPVVEAALVAGRFVGLIQPTSDAPETPLAQTYSVGCLGRIMNFSETDDGRFLVGMQGICRFHVEGIGDIRSSVRYVAPDCSAYSRDVEAGEDDTYDRGHLLEVLRQYFKNNGIAADWNTILNASDDSLISSLAMICPLEMNEKQALLEAKTIRDRAAMLVTLLEMATVPKSEVDLAKH